MMKRACVIGWPVGHSRSPLIHGHWLRAYAIEGSYERVAVEPRDLVSFLGKLQSRGFAGCNVTLPHKEAAFRHVTVTDPLTRRLKAVNTLYLKGGVLHGLNTDGIGFLMHLEASDAAWTAKDGPAVVLGAGGAARAIVATLVDAGVPEIRLANRTRDRATALAREFDGPLVVCDWETRAAALGDARLLVNTTSLGMAGAPRLVMPLDTLPGDATVYDIVYAPLETELLAAARTRGNVAVDGLGMLLHQAVPGFELWFGVRPEVTQTLRDVVVADLRAGM
jgi:shikimate dehydrogenase